MSEDPLRQLEQWGRQAERRVNRARRLRRLGRAATSPVRVARRMGRTGLVVTVVVVALIGTSWVFRDRLTEWGTNAYPRQAHPSGVFATSTTDPASAGPYAGTPAAAFAEGADGITLPAAAGRVGYFDAGEVARALERVRAALIAARLDPRMVVQRDPTAFIALLEPSHRAWVRQAFADSTFGAFASQVAPGYQLSTAPPRVKGRVTYKAFGEQTTLEITTNFVWVYAFDRPGVPAASNIVIVHDEVAWRIHSNQTTEGLLMFPNDGYLSNMDCALAARSLLAPAVPTAVAPDPATEDPAAVYDPDRSLSIVDGCRRAAPGTAHLPEHSRRWQTPLAG